MDSSTLFSRRILNRKIRVHPQKCTENSTENIDTNTSILNTRPTNLLSLKEQQKPKYQSYGELVFPSYQNSLKGRCNNTQNTQENTNVLSCSLPNTIALRSEENTIQKDVSVRAESNYMTSLKVAQKDPKGDWFEEIKKVWLSLVRKIDVFKIMTKNRIVKDHWKEDSTTKCCSFCNRKFTMFFRKHHCRICGNIYCSPCSSGRTLLDPNLAIPAQLASIKNIKYNRNSGGFEFDGFEYNYLDYEDVDQEQFDREHEQYWEYQQQNQKDEFDYELGQDYDLYKHDYNHARYQLEQEFEEFNENCMDDYFSDEYSVTNSSDSSSDSSSLVDFNNITTCDLIYNDDDSSMMNKHDDGIDYGSEPVCERICINCHKVFELDENDWCH